MKGILAAIAVMVSSLAFAGTEHDMAPPKVSPEFEKMKALVGTWEGKGMMHGEEKMLKVTYELTSGGTALMEKFSPGTPHEMITVFANSGKKVNATHYCAIGNQPQMALKKATDNSFQFEMVGTNGINDKKEMHMHGVTLTLEGNKLKEEWTNYNGGKKAETATFEFTKKM